MRWEPCRAPQARWKERLSLPVILGLRLKGEEGICSGSRTRGRPFWQRGLELQKVVAPGVFPPSDVDCLLRHRHGTVTFGDKIIRGLAAPLASTHRMPAEVVTTKTIPGHCRCPPLRIPEGQRGTEVPPFSQGGGVVPRGGAVLPWVGAGLGS